jgi:hypothetical protein
MILFPGLIFLPTHLLLRYTIGRRNISATGSGEKIDGVVDPGDRNLFLNVHPAALVDDLDGNQDIILLKTEYRVGIVE